jgi:uncharacterized membrane protein YqiK
MIVLSVLVAIVVAVLLIAIVVTFLNRFYRKSTRDVALVRTGFGGQRIIISGGCVALPFLHRIEEVNMRTLRIEVRRASEKSLITEDRMRVDVEFEFYVRVLPTSEGIATAAQALGAKSLNPEGLRNLLEGRFIDAIQAVAGRQTMDALHEDRAGFARQIGEQLRDNLSQNGILLDSVSLTRLDQSAFSAFDENNAFNAVGMRKLAEIIAVNKKKRAEIEADADTSVRQTQLDATKRRLLLSLEEEQAQIGQRLEIDKIKATSDAEAAKAREDALTASEQARIGRERQTSAMEVSRRSELRKIEIDSQLNLELRKVDSAIQLAAKHVEEAKAQAQAELARSNVVQAQEQVQTDRELAVAARSHELALRRVGEEGAVETAKAETAASTLLRRIRAESEGERALIDAENTRSDALNRLKLEQYRLDKLPVIVAEMMKPAEKIDSIRIHQISGLGGAPGTATNADPNKPAVNQVMDSILSMALQLPALRSIGDSIGFDFSSAITPSTGTRVDAQPSVPKRNPK